MVEYLSKHFAACFVAIRGRSQKERLVAILEMSYWPRAFLEFRTRSDFEKDFFGLSDCTSTLVIGPKKAATISGMDLLLTRIMHLKKSSLYL